MLEFKRQIAKDNPVKIRLWDTKLDITTDENLNKKLIEVGIWNNREIIIEQLIKSED